MTAEPIARVVADLRAGRVDHPAAFDAPRKVASAEALQRAQLPQPVVDCTAIFNMQRVAEQINVYDDYPSIVPPWENALLCYVNTFNNVIVLQVNRRDWDGVQPDNWYSENEVAWERVRWIAETAIWVGGVDGNGVVLPTSGPCHMLRHAIHEDGSPADINWLALMSRGRFDEQGRLMDANTSTWEAPLVTLGASLNFLGASNVDIAEPARPRPLRRRIERTGVQVQAIVVRPPGKARSKSAAARPIDALEATLTPVRGHFACVDESTEILTRRGWLTHHDVREGDEIAGYDLDARIGRWTRCRGLHRYAYDGPMVAADCRGLSMRLTPNHRTVAIRARRTRRGPEVVLASELRPKYAIPRTFAVWSEDGREKSIGLDLAELCGWVASEGHIDRADGTVRLCQSEAVNPDNVTAIRDLLGRIDLPPADRSGRRAKTWAAPERVSWHTEPSGMVRWRLPLGLSQAILRIMPDKLLPPWMADLPQTEAAALLEAFIDGDGHRRSAPRGIRICQKRRESLDVLQALAVRLGWNASLRHRPGSSSAAWVLDMTRGTPAHLRRSDGRSLLATEHYSGTVWCPTTGTGTFMARRNGYVFITGNSYGERYNRGLLFGKYAGKFWISGHVRGASEGDEPTRDYLLKPSRKDAA